MVSVQEKHTIFNRIHPFKYKELLLLPVLQFESLTGIPTHVHLCSCSTALWAVANKK